MKIYFDEQDVANAICVYVADLEGIRPESVQIEFQFDEDDGVSCQVSANYRNVLYYEQQISDAIGFYLEEIHRFSSYAMEIIIGFDEEDGITSEISFVYS
ncbi:MULTISPECIES: DUF2653 family protein [Bacillaceae]|uniref:DUF2653 family protein n=1 Tax=Bacillaceae TaxID=186817 RepID=UPI000BEC48D5|nr:MULTISPECIES: DUF2653 family protein [unclassified Bacillus (in: firmicutes)]PEC50810.1 hypothetical protein CON00_05080 [Bacillus sp. AFS096315]PFM80002.1 hypothetical protein COJ46_11800 [Bacillus sp. AFS077874]